MKHYLPFRYAALLATFFLANCGEKSTDDTASANDTAKGESTSATAPVIESDHPLKQIEVTGNDQMKFDPIEFTAQPGQPLEVTLKNIGSMPKASMGHNWVLLAKDAEAIKIVENGMTAAGNDYIPPDMENLVVARTKLLGPGESDTVTFNAPSEPGDYEFICTFPGHFQIGMKGTLTVE